MKAGNGGGWLVVESWRAGLYPFHIHTQKHTHTRRQLDVSEINEKLPATVVSVTHLQAASPGCEPGAAATATRLTLPAILITLNTEAVKLASHYQRQAAHSREKNATPSVTARKTTPNIQCICLVIYLVLISHSSVFVCACVRQS